MADLRSEKEQLETLSAILSDYFKDIVLKENPLKNWDLVFTYLENRKNKKEKLILAIDEYPYISEINNSVSSVLQKHWDEKFKKLNVFIILCGSSMSFMEKELLSYKSPLYGRRTGQLEIKPFVFSDISEMFPKATAEELFNIYSIYGGIPAYLEHHNSNKNLVENITSNILKQDNLLYNEVTFLLMQELRTPQTYLSILRAISLGDNKLNDILVRTGLDRQIIIKYLDNLMQLRIIKREVPAGENPQKSRRGLYFFTDNYFRFWFRFVYSYLSLIEEGRVQPILEKIKSDLPVVQGKIFEEVCIKYLKGNSRFIPFETKEISSWWNNNMEIDIIAIGMNNEMLFGECKYTNKPVGINVYNELKTKSTQFDSINKHYVLFSKSGFTDEMKKIAKKEKVNLKTIENLVNG